jgi:FtsP/CotA-like multicopper oxidase with cupredoxin domain
MSTLITRISLGATAAVGLALVGLATGIAKPAPKPVYAAAAPPAMATTQRCDGNASDRFVGSPIAFDEYRYVPGGRAANAVPLLGAALAAPGEKALDLHIVYGIGQFYNPATAHCDTVTLRFYSRTDNEDASGHVALGQFVAPTINITPGDTIHITLHNDLPNDDPTCGPAAREDMDHPHCFNGTNLHSHGLWVSPTGNSDNVLVSIYPKTTFDYIYNVPPDHPAGTFWYHTHLHGSTALQVSSGMAGAIIIRGSRPPLETPSGIRPGDVDLLLKDSPDLTFVLQQIQYGCLTYDSKVPNPKLPVIQVTLKNQADPKSVVNWPCRADQTAIVGPFFGTDGRLGYSDQNGRGYGPGNWGQSNRYTSVNGVVLPTFRAAAGQVNRWRFIHGGVRDAINLRFYRMKPAALAAIPAQGDADFIDRQCTGDPIPYYLVAQDGLTMAQATPTTEEVLEPGYRADVLVVFPADGDYCVVDAASQAPSNVWGVDSKVRLMGKVAVRGGTPVPPGGLEGVVKRTLIAGAGKYIPRGRIQDKVIAGLQNDLRLDLFVPHPEVTADEVKSTPVEQLYFQIGVGGPKTQFLVGDSPENMHEYDMNHVDRRLILGTAQQWQLQSLFVSHPFHIHVNPFQIVAIYDPLGHDVSGPDARDTFRINNDTGETDMNGPVDPEYRGLKGVWKDTIWVKNPAGNPKFGPKAMYKVIIRTRYQRYIGEFVLHCHILDHEDQGMMQNVEIVPPGYSGPGASTSHDGMPGMAGMP